MSRNVSLLTRAFLVYVRLYCLVTSLKTGYKPNRVSSDVSLSFPGFGKYT